MAQLFKTHGPNDRYNAVQEFFQRRAHPARRARRIAGAASGAVYVALTTTIGAAAYVAQPDHEDQPDAPENESPDALALNLFGAATPGASSQPTIGMEDPVAAAATATVTSPEQAVPSSSESTRTESTRTPGATSSTAPTAAPTSTAGPSSSTAPSSTSTEPAAASTTSTTEPSTTAPTMASSSSASTSAPTTEAPTTTEATTTTTAPATTASTSTTVTGPS